MLAVLCSGKGVDRADQAVNAAGERTDGGGGRVDVRSSRRRAASRSDRRRWRRTPQDRRRRALPRHRDGLGWQIGLGRRAGSRPYTKRIVYSSSRSRECRRGPGRSTTDLQQGHLPFPASSRASLRCTKLGCLQGFRRWRDPDSNRGHHDFQGVRSGLAEGAQSLETKRFAVDPSSTQKSAIYELSHAVQEMEASHLLFADPLSGVAAGPS
jgi:hypothetical protein